MDDMRIWLSRKKQCRFFAEKKLYRMKMMVYIASAWKRYIKFNSGMGWKLRLLEVVFNDVMIVLIEHKKAHKET